MCLRQWSLSAHYGDANTHPVELPQHCSWSLVDVVVRRVQKQSVSNAFQYVVPHPAAPSSSEDITATMGRKHLQKYKTFEKTQRKTFKSLEFTKIVRNFAASIQGNSQKGWQPLWPSGRFEPQPYEPSLFGVDGFVLYRYLRNRDAISYSICI